MLEHLPLVYSIVAPFVKIGDVKDSMEYSIGCEALIDAWNSYEAERNDKFGSYAYPLIKNRILEYVRYNKRKKRQANIEDLSEIQWNNLECSAFNVNSDEFLNWLKNSDWSKEDKEDLDILLAVKIQNRKPAKIAEELGISRQTIYDRIQRITEKLKKRAA